MESIKDTYRSISGMSEALFKDRGSKFIARAYPVESEEDVKFYLAELRKEFYDARHHCYSYVLGANKEVYRINDDGEPSGSAGKPIHGQFLSLDISDVLVVVIRYFGGTKLGVPGLINAYKTATREALETADIVIKTIEEEIVIEYDYPLMNPVMNLIKDENLKIKETLFEIRCLVKLSVLQSQTDRIKEKISNIHGIKIQKKEE